MELIQHENKRELTVDRAGYFACRLSDHSPFHTFIVGFTPLIWCPNSELVASLDKPLSPITCTIQAFPLPITSWEKQNDQGHGYMPIKQYFLRERTMGSGIDSIRSCYLPHTRKRREMNQNYDDFDLIFSENRTAKKRRHATPNRVAPRKVTIHTGVEHQDSVEKDGGIHTEQGETDHEKHTGFTFHVTLEFNTIKQSCIGRYILEASNCFKTPTHQLNQFTVLVQDSRAVFYSCFALISEILIIVAIFVGFRKDIGEASSEELPDRRAAVVKREFFKPKGLGHKLVRKCSLKRGDHKKCDSK